MATTRNILRILLALVLGALSVRLAAHSRSAAGAWMEDFHFALGVFEAIGAALFWFGSTAALGGSMLLLSIGTAFGIHASRGQMPVVLAAWALLVLLLSPAGLLPRRTTRT
jgi:hypothetical protein